MAHIDYKDGQYTIAANSSEQFTFWWGRNSNGPHEYFDVSISPQVNRENERMTPLVDVKREVYLDASEGPARNVLLLTLQNNNNFPVMFLANHVRIYS